MKTVLTLLGTLLLALATPAGASDAARPPIVFAAASLKGALDEAAAAFKAQGGGDVTISYAGSNALAKQIEEGAPADLFISADERWADYLGEKKLLKADSRVTLLTNELALIAPKDSAVALEIEPGFDLAGVLGDDKLALADPEAVPAGKYAKAALTALGVWEEVSPNVVGAENVRAALALVARGEAALGIVYITDAKAEPAVKTIGAFPGDTHPPIVYSAALIAASTSAEAASFLTFLRGEAVTAIFAKAGFGRLAN
jgi:molybdate transport system substrate-binding protein